jgi:hypothetical protein
MRIRTVKPEFFTHAELSDIERISNVPIRLAFIGLWCACDREGRFKWDARRLGVQILPYDHVDFEFILDILKTNGFIEKYEIDGKTYGFVPSFHRHQVINNREQESSLPPFQQPDLFSAELTRVNTCESTRESTGESTRADACSGEGKEGKGRKEGRVEEIEIDFPFESEGFREAWNSWVIYRKEKKKKLTPSTIKMQLKKLEGIGEVRAIKMIAYSIENGWEGLFEENVSNVTAINVPSSQIFRKPQTSDNYGI